MTTAETLSDMPQTSVRAAFDLQIRTLCEQYTGALLATLPEVQSVAIVVNCGSDLNRSLPPAYLRFRSRLEYGTPPEVVYLGMNVLRTLDDLLKSTQTVLRQLDGKMGSMAADIHAKQQQLEQLDGDVKRATAHRDEIERANLNAQHDAVAARNWPKGV